MKLLALAAALTLVAGAAQAQTSAQKAESPTNNDASRLGGYAPAAPLFSTGTTPPPGTQVVFVPSTQTPTEAFPPPAPKADYPLCKRGQFDGCRQRGGH
jgi:hypothetical protein